MTPNIDCCWVGPVPKECGFLVCLFAVFEEVSGHMVVAEGQVSFSVCFDSICILLCLGPCINAGAFVITYTVLGVPDYNSSITGPETLF